MFEGSFKPRSYIDLQTKAFHFFVTVVRGDLKRRMRGRTKGQNGQMPDPKTKGGGHKE